MVLEVAWTLLNLERLDGKFFLRNKGKNSVQISSTVKAKVQKCKGHEKKLKSDGTLDEFVKADVVYEDKTVPASENTETLRVDLSDDEQFVRNMPCYVQCVLSIHLVR